MLAENLEITTKTINFSLLQKVEDFPYKLPSVIKMTRL